MITFKFQGKVGTLQSAFTYQHLIIVTRVVTCLTFSFVLQFQNNYRLSTSMRWSTVWGWGHKGIKTLLQINHSLCNIDYLGEIPLAIMITSHDYIIYSLQGVSFGLCYRFPFYLHPFQQQSRAQHCVQCPRKLARGVSVGEHLIILCLIIIIIIILRILQIFCCLHSKNTREYTCFFQLSLFIQKWLVVILTFDAAVSFKIIKPSQFQLCVRDMGDHPGRPPLS